MNALQIIQSTSTAAFVFNSTLFDRFIEYTDVKNTTIKGYTVCIRAFIKYLREQGITQPQRDDIKAYKAHLEAANFTAGTRQQYLRTVKHFFKWTASEGLYPNVADNIKGAKVRRDNTKRDALSESDIQNICNSINTTIEAGKRNFVIILLAITGGLRIIELQRANIEDIKTIAGEKVLFIQGKGRDEKDEYKKLTPEVWEALNTYLQTKPIISKKKPLFTCISNRANGERLTEPSISRIIKGVLKAAGYDSDRITAHSLRHTSVTMLLKAGATIQEAQYHARHADPATTGIYAHNINRATQYTEQRIYDYIFKPQSKALIDEATEILKGFSANQLKQFIRQYRNKVTTI